MLVAYLFLMNSHHDTRQHTFQYYKPAFSHTNLYIEDSEVRLGQQLISSSW